MPCRMSPNSSIHVQSNPMENHSTGMLINVMEIPRAKMTLITKEYQENHFIHLGGRFSRKQPSFGKWDVTYWDWSHTIHVSALMNLYTERQNTLFCWHHCRTKECYINFPIRLNLTSLMPWTSFWHHTRLRASCNVFPLLCLLKQTLLNIIILVYLFR